MATIDNLFESGQGKLGNLVFYKVGGYGRVRTKAAHYTDKKSPAQLAQRQRLQVAAEFLRPFRDLIRITFKSQSGRRSAMQAAQSYNMRNAMAGEYPNVYVDKSRALLSRGPLPLPAGTSITAQPGGLLLEWQNNKEDAIRHPHDTLVVMAKSAENGYIDYRFTETLRSNGRYVWKPGLPEGNVDMWIAFRNRSETDWSDSMFLGSSDYVVV